jgi:hypothetical protein
MLETPHTPQCVVNFLALLGLLTSAEQYLICYDLGSSLHKRDDLQGKDGSTSVLQNLTNDLARTDVEDDVRWMGTSGSKGQPLTAVAEVGVEDTGSDGY